MIRINLLPFRAARTKENIRRQVTIFLLLLLLCVVVLFAGSQVLARKQSRLESRLKYLKEEVVQYKKKAKKVEEFKAKLAEIEKRSKIVKQLMANKDDPPKLLAAITEMIIPGRMQLNSMSLQKGKLEFNGIALDNETIAVFIKRLEKSGLFSDVELVLSRQTTYMNVEMKEFKITCTMKKKNVESEEEKAGKDKKKKKARK